MAALKWDQTGEKIYETGDKKCVLFVMKADGSYDNGVAWNGITAVSSNDSGAEETALWADDIKYAVMRSAPEYGGSIEAYQCPEEFYICDGRVIPSTGLVVGQQGRRGFGLSYVTTIGNDVQGTDYGYKVHLVWGASASPSERSYQTINDSPDAITLSWEFSTTPVSIDGHPELKPTSHIIIDSTKISSSKLKALEDIIYGTENEDPVLPSPGEVIDMMKASEPEDPYQLLYNRTVAGEADQYYEIGDEIDVTYNDGTNEYECPFVIVDIRNVTNAQGHTVPGVILQSKYGIDAPAFDTQEAAYVVSSSPLPAGTYYFTIGTNDFDQSSYGNNPFAAGSYWKFTTTEAIPVGGQIVLNIEYVSYTAGYTITCSTYSSPRSSTPIETVSIDRTSQLTGTETNLGTLENGINYSETGVNEFGRAYHGYGRYPQSSIRQWLNKTGIWWAPMNVYDRPPEELETKLGLKECLTEGFVDILSPIRVSTTLNKVETFQYATETCTGDHFYIASVEEMFGNGANTNYPEYSLSNEEGPYFPYWKQKMQRETPTNIDVYARAIDSISNHSSKTFNILRSPNPAKTYSIRYINMGGEITSTNADTTGTAVNPVCVVCDPT